MSEGKLHAKNGEVTVEGHAFLPLLSDAYTEYELKNDDIVVENYEQPYTGRAEVTPPAGHYTKITALVRVTRLFPKQ